MAVVAVHALAALLTYLCLATEGLPQEPSVKFHHRLFHVPAGKVHVYKYSAVVKAGQNEPTPFASKFQIRGKLIHKQDVSDSNLKYVDYLKFHDVEHTVYNGPDDGDVHGVYQAVDDAIKDFEEPILVVRDESNKLQGIKIQEKEAIWSKNMKKSFASLIQINIQQFPLDKLLRTTFQTVEKTIHGDCHVDYSLYGKIQAGKELYYVRKKYEPRRCSKYVQHAVNDAKSIFCNVQAEEDLVTSAEKVYEFELADGELILKKMVSHEKSSYLPYLHRTVGIQYIETNQTFEFEKAINEPEIKLPAVDFKNVLMINDISFDNHNISTAEDNYFGRNIVKSSDIIEKVIEYLIMMVDYFRENHVDVAEIHPEHKNLLQKLHHIMKNLDSKSMHYIYRHFNSGTEKENMIRKIFLELIPHTGTYAAWNFTQNMILTNEVPDETTAVEMLTNLPIFITNPNEELVKSMIDFKFFHKELKSTKIIYAGILCYSILLHKTYKNVGKNVPEFLQNELAYFNQRIRFEPTYQSKIVYIMAMRNIEVGNIYQYLADIINEENIFAEKPDIAEKYRRAAMWAVAKSISHDKELTNKLFWPIIFNSSQPLLLRMTAYEFLVPRNPMIDMNLLMNVHEIMMEERDEHMFNYHYTTMKNMAESTDPCLKNISEMMRKVFRLAKRRVILSSALSSVTVFDYFDDKYGYGKTFKIGVGINEASGIPYFGYYEMISMFRKSWLDTGIYWNIDGVNLGMIVSLVKNLIQHGEDNKNEQAPYEISDEKVKNLLRQTYGHKLLDKHIHVEFWTVSKGYVTNVEVLSEVGLSTYLKEYVTSYKPRNIMDVKEKFNRIWLDISFYNQYKMIVATDIGIPAIFYNESPNLLYMKLKPNIYPFQTILAMKLEFEARIYYHNCYKMKFYNPFADLTHSIRRDVSSNFALPLDLTISLNLKTYSWKMVIPRLPETRFSVAGIRTYVADRVEVGKDFTGVLKNYCSTCKHLVDVTNGLTSKNNYEKVLHSKETGLEYKFNTFDCENERIPVIEYEEFFRMFKTKENNINDDPWPSITMKIHHELFNFIHAPYESTCGKMLKISPCTVYPTSHIEMNWRFNMKNLNGRVNLDIDGSVDIKGASANQTGSYWDVNIGTDLSQFVNELKLHFTRRIPGEKNFKICLNAAKVYPNIVIEPKQETNTKITFLMGHTDNEHCVYDDSAISVTVTVKGELLDEQIEHMKRNVKPGSCFKNPTNAMDLNITSRFDWNCLYEAVKGTTMRKYTVNATYKNIPQEVLAGLLIFDDYLRHDSMPYLTYKSNHVEPGNVKIFVTYSVKNNYGNITVMNPYFTYELLDLQYGPDDPEDRRNDLLLDNIGFSTNFLVDYYKGEIRPCIAHPSDLITDLNQTIPMEFKDWTLLSGDHELMAYAVFAKADQYKMWVRIYASMHVLEIQPGNAKPVVILNGEVISNYEKGILLPVTPENESFFKISMVNQLFMVETDKFSKVKIFYTPYNVVILPHIILDKNIDGVCGHMGSTAYVQEIPLVYI